MSSNPFSKEEWNKGRQYNLVKGYRTVEAVGSSGLVQDRAGCKYRHLHQNQNTSRAVGTSSATTKTFPEPWGISPPAAETILELEWILTVDLASDSHSPRLNQKTQGAQTRYAREHWPMAGGYQERSTFVDWWWENLHECFKGESGLTTFKEYFDDASSERDKETKMGWITNK